MFCLHQNLRKCIAVSTPLMVLCACSCLPINKGDTAITRKLVTCFSL